MDANSNASHDESKKQSQVSSESYPISQPLATILRIAVQLDDDDDCNSSPSSPSTSISNITVIRDSAQDALQNIIRNCFVAMDEMYFYTQPSKRKKDSFQHRLCIRISTNEEENSLSITDYGSGMTRSDLINALGVGSRLSSDALMAARGIHTEELNRLKAVNNKECKDNDKSNHQEDDNESVSSSSSSDSSSSSSTVSDNADDVDENINDDTDLEEEKIIIPCTAKDIGGFYASLCTLGVAVEIGTKSKFDEYYEFKLSSHESNGEKDKASFSTFTIARPMDEGQMPSAYNGYNKFNDVRGESGTRITIKLNKNSIQAGMLNQKDVLKPMLEKLLEASPYSVILDQCCTSDEERQDVINASQREIDEAEEAARKIKEYGDNGNNSGGGEDEDLDVITDTFADTENGRVGSHNTVKERSKFIPLRLSMGERKMLRLVEATMACCDYTTDVDKLFKSSTRRTHAQMKKIASVLRGMVSSCDYNSGQTLLKEDNFSDYKNFFRQMFEIARRHKIMNPEKMRSEYGKLIYLLQDAVSPSIQPHLQFSCKGNIETVYKFLEEKDSLEILDDKLIDIATREILAEKKTRAQIGVEIKRKEKAVSILKQKYRTSSLSSDDIHLCLYSICDNDSFLNSNRVPVDKVIGYLHHFFSPGKIEEGYSLSIVSGEDGSRLSHSHDRQFYFALQSLTLWRDIIDDMFRLWAMAEEDLLSESITYSLKDTGQGMQRVQQSPLTYKSMQKILVRVQGKVHQWIGSNVIHLGDHNVPNSLTFIDKYTQVPRILSPIVSCLENIERICEEDDGIDKLVRDGFGGVEQLKKDILYDFFKSAFDGSGADNFYDAGSCIDGRLTSAWNWCSQLPDKPFYCIFKLTGFTGFDGEFK